MNEKQNNKQIPVTLMMDLVKSEIKEHVLASMQNNHLPPGIMVYILESIEKDLIASDREWLERKHMEAMGEQKPEEG